MSSTPWVRAMGPEELSPRPKSICGDPDRAIFTTKPPHAVQHVKGTGRVEPRSLPALKGPNPLLNHRIMGRTMLLFMADVFGDLLLFLTEHRHEGDRQDRGRNRDI